MKHVAQYWERYLFATMGIGFMLASIIFLVQEKLAFFSTTFAVSFFCFFYSNLARFKRFKGLGFEAELWEDKQKEAADLIERLKSVVTVYTREIVMSRVMMGRIGGGARWQAHWNLFDELVSQHAELGQQIDFAPLKHQIDTVFLFDIANHLQGKLFKPLQEAKIKAREIISAEFGSPIKDPDGYGRRQEQLHKVLDRMDNLFERSATENVARATIENAVGAADHLKSEFGIEVVFDQTVLDDLKIAADAADHRPVAITQKLIALADRQGG